MEQQAWPDSRRIFSSTHSGATSSWRLFRQLWDSENLFSPVSPVLPSMAFTSVVTGSDLKHPICHRLASIRSSPLMWSMSESLDHWSSGGTTAQQPEKEGQFWKYHLGTNCQFSDALMKHTRNSFNTSNLKTCWGSNLHLSFSKSTLYTSHPRIEQWNEVRSLRSKPHHLGHFWGGPQGLRVIPQWPSGPVPCALRKSLGVDSDLVKRMFHQQLVNHHQIFHLNDFNNVKAVQPLSPSVWTAPLAPDLTSPQ